MINSSTTFFKIPKILFSSSKFKNISCEAKLLYSLFLDRLNISKKNNWSDKNGNVFIIFSNDEISKTIGCGIKKVIKLISELKSYGLVETKRIGLGKPNRIYVNQPNDTTCKDTEKKDLTIKENKNIHFSEIHNSYKQIILNNKFFKKQNPIYLEKIRNNISYEILINQYPNNKDIINELVEIMLETILSNKKFIKISGDKVPLESIKDRFLKINYLDMEYILECLDNNFSNIKNIKAYLISVLYNCKNTINNYYKNRVNYDTFRCLVLKE